MYSTLIFGFPEAERIPIKAIINPRIDPRRESTDCPLTPLSAPAARTGGITTSSAEIFSEKSQSSGICFRVLDSSPAVFAVSACCSSTDFAAASFFIIFPERYSFAVTKQLFFGIIVNRTLERLKCLRFIDPRQRADKININPADIIHAAFKSGMHRQCFRRVFIQLRTVFCQLASFQV